MDTNPRRKIRFPSSRAEVIGLGSGIQVPELTGVEQNWFGCTRKLGKLNTNKDVRQGQTFASTSTHDEANVGESSEITGELKVNKPRNISNQR